MALEQQRAKVGEIPVLWIDPGKREKRRLIIWLTGFSGSKESCIPQLQGLAQHGYVALSFDPYQHGERRIEPQPQLVTRVRGNIRRYFWPILAKSAEEVIPITDWAVRNLGVLPETGMGGTSMGGDISVAAAGVDRRIKAVSAIVATPDWLRAGSFEPPGEPDTAALADYDRRNPMTHLQAYHHCPAIAFQGGNDDRQVPQDAAERFIAALKKGPYRHCPDRLKLNLFPKMGHGYKPEMLTASIEWFDRWLA